MQNRFELRKAYAVGWDTWDSDLLISSLAPGFVFKDPGYPDPVTADNMAEFMSGWLDRVRALGGTGEIGSRDRVYQDQDGALISWHWWSFVGTNFEGAAVTRTTDEGVLYEQMTYRGSTTDKPGGGRTTGVCISGSNQTWTSWNAPGGTSTLAQPRYQTFFSDEENQTRGLAQGLLEYPPGARCLAHWHTPAETHYVLSGNGIGHIGDDTVDLNTGDAVYVPGKVVHWLENPGQEALCILWTLNCDNIGDIDFIYVE